jgi:hypothetical protein
MQFHSNLSPWRKWCVLACLVVFFSISVGHVAHMCPLYLAPAQHGPAASVNIDANSMCLTCLALHSSAAEPLFTAAAPQGMVGGWPPVLYESPLKPATFFQFFVRPPPAS